MKARLLAEWDLRRSRVQLQRRTSPEGRLSLRANFYWVLMGNLVYVFCQWGMLVALAKFSNTEAVGVFSLGLAVTAPITMFARLRLRDVQVTDARQEYLTADYFGLRVVTSLLGLLIIVGIVLFGSYSFEARLVILIIGIAKAFESMSDILYGVLQFRERMDFIGKSMALKGILSLLALSLLLILTGSVVWAVIGLAATWGAYLALYDFPVAARLYRLLPDAGLPTADGFEVASPQRLRPLYRFGIMTRLAWLALPMGLITLFGSLDSTTPRYFIEHYWGQRELGIFAALAYVVTASRTVIMSLGRATTPRLASYYASGQWKHFFQLLLVLSGIELAMGSAAVFVAILFGREILLILYQSEYADASGVFVWLMAAATLDFVATQWNYAALATRRFAVQLPLAAINTALTLGYGFLLIPREGMRGAAITLLLNSAGLMVGSALIIFYVQIREGGAGARFRRHARPPSASAVPGADPAPLADLQAKELPRPDRPLRVLTITHALYAPPWDEGVKNLLHRLVEFLNGQEVLVATVSLRTAGPHGNDTGLRSRLAVLGRYSRCIREFEPDVILMFSSCRSWLGLKTLLFKLLGRRKPLVLYLTSLDLPVTGYRFLWSADRVLVNSPFLQRYFPGAPLIYPFLPSQIHPQEIPPPPARTAGEPLEILFLGAWEPGRGVEVLIEAVARAKAQVPVRLTLALNTYARLSHDRLLALIEQQGVTENVTLKGYVDHTEAYGQCHVVVIPRTSTQRMSFPVRIIESLAAGRPLVVTTACDMDQLIAGCGLAVPPGDAARMAEAFVRLSDPDFYAACAAHTAALVDCYDSGRTLHSLLHELRQASR